MKKGIRLFTALLMLFLVTACSSSQEATKEEKEKIYTTGDTTIYKEKDQELGTFTVNSISNTDERNEFADSQPEQVVIIHYTYENKASQDDLFYSSVNFKVIDEGGNVCETYPASLSTYPQAAPQGSKCEGEEAYGLKQQSSKIKLVVNFDYLDNKVTYELPIQ